MDDQQWVRCPGCNLQYRQWQLLQCVRCRLGYCVSCSRGVNVYDQLTGRKSGEGWICSTCREEIGPENYRPVFKYPEEAAQ